MVNRHLPHDLAQMQSIPLEGKILMTKERIRQWYEYWDGQVYVSFSGGKDSTVLKHIVDSMYDDVPALFVNTGLEYPEIQSFVRDIKTGKHNCFNTDIEIARPEMRFDEVVKKYGYPVVSKEVAECVEQGRMCLEKNDGSYTYRLQKLLGTALDKEGNKSKYNHHKWKFLLDAPFKISSKCCNVMKKSLQKNTAKKQEENLILQQWLVKVG